MCIVRRAGMRIARGRTPNRPIELALVTLLTVDGDSVARMLSDENGQFLLESPLTGDFVLWTQAR